MIGIEPGNLRDITYVAANMRERDREEVLATAALDCASPAGWLSWAVSGPDWCWTAQIDGQPVGAFGIGQGTPLQPHIRTAWAFGTDRFKRVVPVISRFCRENWPEMLISVGVTRVEIRSLASHDIAARWLKSMGARQEALMTGYGVNSEDFVLWALLKKDFE